MSQGIKAKTVTKGKEYDKHAKRYVFYPLSNLDFAATQFSSPVWNPKFPRGRIVLLESLEYRTQVYDGDAENGFNGVALGERVMGTDAQVKFLMGNTDGTGYMDKGMTYIEILTDVDPVTVEEIESLIFPDNKVPDNLIKFRNYLLNLNFSNVDNEKSSVESLAAEVQKEMLKAVNTAINWCMSYTNQIEQELKDGQSGGVGIKYLSETNKYYFYQIEKPLPEDRAGTNMGKELANVLAPLMATTGAAPINLKENLEIEELKRKLKESEETIKEQAEALELMAETEEDTDEN